MPTENAPPIAAATQLGIDELTRRAEFLRTNEDFRKRLIGAFQSNREEPEPSPHVEHQLYDGFFPTEDEALAQQFHVVPWEERPAIVAAFKDRRLRKIGQRLIYLERPDLLAAAERVEYDRAVAMRIAKDDADLPWLTLPRALTDLNDLITDADPGDVAFLQDHCTYLTDRLERAMLMLNPPNDTAQ